MKWNKLVADYFSFTKKERIGLISLTCLIVLAFLLPKTVSQSLGAKHHPADTSWIAALRKIEIREADREKETSRAYPNNGRDLQYDRTISNNRSVSLFYFDPNTIDANGWRSLGVPEKTIRTIQNYLSKGGHFYKAGDLKRVYGFTDVDYTRLEPFIRIAARENRPETLRNNTPETKRYTPRVIDINKADTSAFISLPGIGTKLASRIVNFREKLGGFYSVDQVGEVYGLADSTFQKIKQYLQLDNISITKININTATVDQLKVHPYVKYSIANALVAYRNQHGPFKQVEDIRRIMAITPEIYNKLIPYFTVN